MGTKWKRQPCRGLDDCWLIAPPFNLQDGQQTKVHLLAVLLLTKKTNMSTEKEPIRYEIDSLEKLVNLATSESLTEKEFQQLVTDTALWLAYARMMIAGIRKDNPKKTKGKSATDIADMTFVWINDGKNDLLETKVVDRTTGQVTMFKGQ